jgi:epoxide hydrolase-like predicted phosphatase
MIKTVIFDWGGVLIEETTSGIINYCADKLKINPVNLKSAYRLFIKDLQTGIISEEQFWQKINSRIKLPHGLPVSLWDDAIKHVFKESREVFRILEMLKQNGYRTALLSNTELPAIKYLSEKDYHKYFDEFILSCNERCAKPNAGIYTLALMRLNARAEETVFIDDNLDNVLEAKRCGMRVIWFYNASQLETELYKLKIVMS